MPHVIRVSKAGGPEEMEWIDAPMPEPGAGEIRVRQEAIGVNFVDVYYRSGLYPPPGGFPYVPGAEGAGVVDAVGEGVKSLKVGDRVVYQGWVGAYAEQRLWPADRAVKLPDTIDSQLAAATFLKGVTAEVLLNRTYKVGPGTTLLLHAAAGGVGVIMSQWAAALGATVIGTVGSADKMEVAEAAGCAHVINYRDEDFVARVKEITGGAGVDVAYDSVGKDVFPGSLDCLKPLGLWVSFGQSSGLPPAFQTSLLQSKGSLFATRPTIAHYLGKREDLEAAAGSLFNALETGRVTVEIGQRFALKDAQEAHRALEGRRTTGPTVLLP